MPNIVMPNLEIERMMVDRDRLDKAINGIYGAFAWNAHPDGAEYWQAVADRLEAIRGAASLRAAG